MKYVGDRGRRSSASSAMPAAQTLFRQTLLTQGDGVERLPHEPLEMPGDNLVGPHGSCLRARGHKR
jgi:hypothetical protein